MRVCSTLYAGVCLCVLVRACVYVYLIVCVGACLHLRVWECRFALACDLSVIEWAAR